MNCSVRIIPFTGLQVVRGIGGGYSIHNDLPRASLVIRYNYEKSNFLNQIDFRNLRAIQNGDAYIFDNPIGCQLISGASLDSLFADPHQQRLHYALSTEPSAIAIDTCGTDPARIFRERCQKRGCDWCFETKDNEARCCDVECLGGCTGPTAADCLVCKHYRDGNVCVPRCPQPALMVNYRLALNVDFKYEFGGMCVRQCPTPLLAQGTRCVLACQVGQYYASRDLCIPCTKNCPKVCSIDNDVTFKGSSSLDSRALAKLENCTVISGNVIISEESYSSQGDSWKAIRSTEELWNLHSVREVTGFINLDLRRHPEPLRNLTFLENLRTIGGSHAKYSLAVSHAGIQFPGLHNLRSAPHGEIVFMESSELCYVQTIGKANRGNATPAFNISLHRAPSSARCEAKGALCHPSCDPDYGCWGPRSEDCLRCRNRSIDGSKCVDSCYEVPGYYNPLAEESTIPLVFPAKEENPLSARLTLVMLAAGHMVEETLHKTFEDFEGGSKGGIACGRCHPECARSCLGPGADQCDDGGCRNAKYNNECVNACPRHHYLNARTRMCAPCQPQCHRGLFGNQTVCSGPGHNPGPGGCHKCEQFLEIITFDALSEDGSGRTQHGALLCLHRGPCPRGTFGTFESLRPYSRFAPFVEDGVHAVPVCRSCHHLCSACTGYGLVRAQTTVSGCLECKGYWFNDTCVADCPDDSTFQISLTHPPEMRKALHFKESVNDRGLLLSSKLSHSMEGDSSAIARPQIWTRHLHGRCLVCHEECLGGCWGPSLNHCRRCAHFRVWRISDGGDGGANLWQADHGETLFLLNRETLLPRGDPQSLSPQAQEKNHRMRFSCELTCPTDLPYASIDPLTGDRTCHYDRPPNSVYIQPTKFIHLGAGFLGPLVFVIVVLLVCVLLVCYCKKRRKSSPSNRNRNETMFYRLSGLFHKMLRLYRKPAADTNGQFVSLSSTGGLDKDTVCPCCSAASSEDRGTTGMYAASNRITWSSDGSICQSCRSSYERSQVPLTGMTCRHSDSHNLIYRRSARQQPNMGRLVIINVDDIQMPTNKLPLGSGAFGAVYKGVWRMPDNMDGSQLLTFRGPDHSRRVTVAVKILNESSGGANDLQALLEEVKVMCSVRHRHCLRLLGVCLAGSRNYLVSEYIANGSLDAYLRRWRTKLPNRLLLLWADQIADGMAYLQSAGIIHRDLATRNVLLKEVDLVQITDFGLAKMLNGDEDQEEVVVQSGRVPIRWLAIETLVCGRYSFKTDIWAYGVTLWEIFTFGQRPYPSIETKDVKRFILSGGHLSQPDICTLQAYQKLLLACWCENPDERASFLDVLQLLRSKADTPEYFLHSRSESGLLGAESRRSQASGVYSEVMKVNRSPSSPASTRETSLLIRPPSTFSANAAVGTPDVEVDEVYGGVPSSLAPENRSKDQESAEVNNQSSGGPINVDGGYVWPVPFPGAAAAATSPAVGEYVGPFFSHPSP